ncbi:MAG: hypothetical protein A3C11_00060 [Candidatus Sungbacteria bacterium RIFCSPHIGHO2_02_FULL_49_12]|uniref:Uncharacterized protein n=1 Tax=Candidatus Sungbacteria bacterium RIFCSPHIGHO2_02_FULL_49_12 TaxID=1802271 RepID=A0A1G2KTU1_9BACT|nr:MAG: hypothetical protein A3C11_00060 [Candidatus Sungbacteria bacterium RIFCSPHIGHO2_02_FULL_49_12]
MKPRHIFVSILAILLMGFLVSQDSFARTAWQKYRWPRAAVVLDRRDAPLAMIIGNYYFSSGAYDLAIAENAYRKAVAIDPKILWGHYQLARILFVKGNSEEALDEINRELEANPENLRSLYVRGLIYGYTNRSDKAAEDFQRFTEWAPTEWAGYNDLAWALSKGGRYKEALAVIMTALDKVPRGDKNPWLWNAKGVAELNLADYNAAAASFAKAKSTADQLTLDAWHKAYPGNDPASATSGLDAFRNAIIENLQRAEAHLAP